MGPPRGGALKNTCHKKHGTRGKRIYWGNPESKKIYIPSHIRQDSRHSSRSIAAGGEGANATTSQRCMPCIEGAQGFDGRKDVAADGGLGGRRLMGVCGLGRGLGRRRPARGGAAGVGGMGGRDGWEPPQASAQPARLGNRQEPGDVGDAKKRICDKTQGPRPVYATHRSPRESLEAGESAKRPLSWTQGWTGKPGEGGRPAEGGRD